MDGCEKERLDSRIVAANRCHQGLVVLVGRVEICMTKGVAFIITPRVDERGILLAPILEAAFLLVVGNSSRSVLWHCGRLEVVSQYKD